MAFEVREKDLLARIGRLKTKSGTVEMPLLFPVINPSVQLISPKKIREEFGFEALITNAYILKKHFQNQPVEEGLHKFLDYDGIVMTDSGAYQIERNSRVSGKYTHRYSHNLGHTDRLENLRRAC
jgi:7-cyano-7-deazaguanine tRNA-ribosyltransferase